MLISNCRLCGSSQIEKVIDLGTHPLADTFLTEKLMAELESTYPLQVCLCNECGHVSTMYAISAKDRYQKHDYSYDSSNSKVSISHFKEFSDSVLNEFEIEKNSIIVDIGSNVGTLLSSFQKNGYLNTVGIEPSKNICDLANTLGVNTINHFFDESVISELGGHHSVKVLLSSNVVNHADDLNSFLDTAYKVLNREGIFVFEVPYLLSLIQKVAFDTIYHEHVHYCGVKPLSTILEKHGFFISKIEEIDYMCGSIRIFASIGDNKHSQKCYEMIDNEEEFGIYSKAIYNSFMDKVKEIKINTISQLSKIKLLGGNIIGIGAATKGNTFLNYCNIDYDLVSCISEASSLKVGKFTPGSRIPIIHDSKIDDSYTHALILPWNIAPMLQKKLSHIGFEFFVPQANQILHKI